MSAQILNRFEVNKALVQLIEEADREITFITPYIKLNDIIKNAMRKHVHKRDFKMTVVFGKNEEDNRMSLSDKDFDFFKQFQNVEIRYHKRLHAKLYANDFDCLITSMNLHDYSMKENIEIGVLIHMNLLKDLGSVISSVLGSSLEAQARAFADYVISKGQLHFEKSVTEKRSFFGLIKSYENAQVSVDKRKMGFCIRKGVQILYNTIRPYSEDAFNSWNQYKNPDYKEKYCHRCGKVFATSMKYPECFDCFHSKNK